MRRHAIAQFKGCAIPFKENTEQAMIGDMRGFPKIPSSCKQVKLRTQNQYFILDKRCWRGVGLVLSSGCRYFGSIEDALTKIMTIQLLYARGFFQIGGEPVGKNFNGLEMLVFNHIYERFFDSKVNLEAGIILLGGGNAIEQFIRGTINILDQKVIPGAKQDQHLQIGGGDDK